MDNLGYCCINTALRNIKPAKNSVFCSRTMTKKTFNLQEASKRALQNCKDLLVILKYNLEYDIKVFRISSDLFPRFTCREFGYNFEKLPEHKEIAQVLKSCGDFAAQYSMQLSFHPGPFTTLASPNDISALSGMNEVEYHSFVCDLIDPNNVLDIPINFHIGGSYGCDWENTSYRFINRFNKLSSNARKRICIENDDKKNGWSVQRIYNYIHKQTGLPICFDAHHWLFCRDDDEMEYDYNLAKTTWGNRSMQIHYSESANNEKLVPAHSFSYLKRLPKFIDIHGNNHIHLECKGKELGLFDMRKLYKEI
jgi:UV DNA damage endonuclease